MTPNPTESEPVEPDDLAAFTQFLDRVERDLAEITEQDHRAAIDQILQDANRIEAAQRLNFNCPACGVEARLIIGETQAVCSNDETCHVITFNPSLPDGGMSQVTFLPDPFGRPVQ